MSLEDNSKDYVDTSRSGNGVIIDWSFLDNKRPTGDGIVKIQDISNFDHFEIDVNGNVLEGSSKIDSSYK